MARKLRVVALVVLGVLVVAVGLVALVSSIRSKRFRAQFEGEKAALLARGREGPARVVDPAAVAALPAPVRRYVEASGVLGRPVPRGATLTQRGALRGGADQPWMPFQSDQAFAFDPPGFVWFADARVAPLVHVIARDAFLEGRGNMLIKLLGAFVIADGRGPEIDQGAGLRFWGEIVAFPEAVVSPGLRWEAVDDRHARLRVSQGALALTALVDFDDEGMPVGVHAERYRDVKGVGVLTPWSGRSLDWKDFGGRRFPSRWESVWHLPGGDLTAVTMEVLSVRTE